MSRMSVADRRAGLIAAALRVIAARGLGAASVRAIVAEAGMSLASFHYAFSSREELFDTLVAEVLATEEKAVIPDSLAGRGLAELLEEGLLGYLTHLRDNPTHEQAMLELTQYALRTRPALAKNQYVEYTRIAVASLELAASHAGVEWTAPVTSVAKLLIAFSDGLTLSWLVERDDAAAREMIRATAQSLAALAE